MRHVHTLIALVVVASLASACGSGTNDSLDATPDEVVLVAYDAFTPEKGIFDDFTKSTGATVRVVTGGDSGAVVNKAILTAGRPEGDVLWGIDNTILSRAKEARVLEQYLPVDEGDVCVNYSRSWYASRGLTPPASMDDLVNPAYKNQMVIEDPTNSSPGLAFLLATIARYGESRWKDWWRQLSANGVRIVSDWTTAWTVEYAGGGNPGSRPMVVSYGSSPPAEIVYAADPSKVTTPDSAVIESTCFRQTEYVGVLRGSRNPRNARALVDYLLARHFQESMPLSLFVFPVNADATIPEVFSRWAVRATSPLTLDPDVISAHLQEWLDTWRAIAL